MSPEDQAYEEGKLVVGTPPGVKACPYTDPSLAGAWVDGYVSEVRARRLRADMAQWAAEGARAHARGVPRESCPYDPVDIKRLLSNPTARSMHSKTVAAGQWRAGWDAAEQRRVQGG